MPKQCILCEDKDELNLLMIEYDKKDGTPVDRWWICRKDIRETDSWEKAKNKFYGNTKAENGG